MSDLKKFFETKFTAPFHQRNKILALLSLKTNIPKYFSSGSSSTVYFDTADAQSYFESRDGVLYRQKYRFRKYINPTDNGAFYSIEIKIRSNAETSKLKKLIYKKLPSSFRYNTFRHLINALESFTDTSFAEFKSILPHKELYPSAMIKYSRFRFDDRFSTKRYNLDTNIMISPSVRSSENGFYCDYDIFEVKSENPLDYPDFINELMLTPFSVSKFLWGKEISV